MSVQTEMFLYYQLGWPGCGSRSLRNKCRRLVQSNPYMKPRIRLSSVVKRNAIHLLAERVKFSRHKNLSVLESAPGIGILGETSDLIGRIHQTSLF